MKTTDPIELFAALNPLPAGEVEALERSPERERTLALINARRSESVKKAGIGARRVALVAIAFALVLAVPALALSGQLSSLFGFSNQGGSVHEIDLRAASALDLTGAKPGTLKLLGSRGGVGIYFARDKGGDRCYFLGPPSGHLDRVLSGGCLNATASRSFPSPEQPLINMSAYVYPVSPSTPYEGITRLAGVAADGVTKVQALGLDCRVVAGATVLDNIYVGDVPRVPAVAIQALDLNGRRIFLDKLRSWDRSACAPQGAG
jgi:hypothetical protein